MFRRLLRRAIAQRLVTALSLMVLLGVLAAIPAFAQEGPVAITRPTDAQVIGWAAFQGAPTIVDGNTRIWVWNEKTNGQNKLRIRTTTDGSSHTFTGTVSTGTAGNFYNLALVNGDGDDSTTVVGYNQFTFSVTTTSGGSGVDVDWSGRWLALDLYIDGYHHPAQVRYGAHATAGDKLPLMVRAGIKGLLTLPLSMLDGPTAFQPNIADGYYLYRDANGHYHLRLTTTKQGDVVDYKGVIRADRGEISIVKVYKGDERDYYTLTGNDMLKFRFVTNGYVDGLDWRLTKGGLIFTLRMNGQIAAPNIALGSNPFGSIHALSFHLVP